MENSSHEIFRKRICLSTLGEQHSELQVTLHALEYQNPYSLSMIITNPSFKTTKIEISKEELAKELKLWLNGKTIDSPSRVVSSRINESIMNFLKFGRPPAQTDIFLWMLSRTEIITNGNNLLIYFGGIDDPISQNGNYSTSEIKACLQTDPLERSYQSSTFHTKPTERSKSAPTQRTSTFLSNPFSSSHHGTSLTQQFTSTEQVIGKSQALGQLSKTSVKGRNDAKKTLVNLELTDDHYRLMNHIQRRRKDIEQAIESRRRIIATGSARNDQTMQKYRQIHDETSQSQRNNSWIRQANHEVMTLDRIQTALDEDIKRQQIQNQRNNEHIRWTMAPNGYEIYRGKSQKGYVIGSGPLPADATTSLRDPRLISTCKQFSWDQHGRRHVKRADSKDEGKENANQSVMEEAMEILRRASTNASLYKLNLKDLFHEMDSSGDGYLTISEFNSFFHSLGLQINPEILQILFTHFDANGSGSIHFSEFLWSFFNRRHFLKQWKHKTKSLSDSQIRNIFHQFDVNGNGTLNQKEFEKLIQKFQIKLSRNDVEVLMGRFDRDGDGELDLEEFYEYIQQEMKATTTTTTTTTTSASITLPSKTRVHPGSSKRRRGHQVREHRRGESESFSRKTVSSSSNLNPNESMSRESISSKNNRNSGVLFSPNPSSQSIPFSPSGGFIDPPPYAAESEDEGGEHGTENLQNHSFTLNTHPTPLEGYGASVDQIQQLLQKQRQLENKLGKKYYKTIK
jgi:Ca2+-binding EF-hand superfamily protein